MGTEKTLSSTDLERLLLHRRRQEAMEGLRLLTNESSENEDEARVKPFSNAGLARPGAMPSTRPARSCEPPPPPPGSYREDPAPSSGEDEAWLRQPHALLQAPRTDRRRSSHPLLVALKRGLGQVIDGLIVFALILFVTALGFWFYENYLRPRLQGSNPTAVRAQGGSEPRLGQGYLSSPDEAMPQPPLPFVAYSTTVSLETAFIPAPTPAPGTVRPSRLMIPRIQLDTAVVEVTVENGVWQVAQYAAGYHRGTARPGTVGNTVIAGHKGLHGAVFRRLEEMAPGDEVLLYAGPRLYRYIVEEQKSVWPHQVEVMAQTARPILTLITCTTYDTQRLIVVARFDQEIPTGVEDAP